MYIQHNMAAISTRRELNVNEKKTENTTEHLASGYRVNRAADDAAGLQISEKMRYQVRGLEQAARNANDGISMIQTADAALGEVHSVLHRMNELAVQAANDTNQDVDRDAIQNEIDQMKKEINRISRNTTFNDIPILRMPQLIEFKDDEYSDIKMSDAYMINGKNRYGTEIDFSKITQENVSELIGKQFTVSCSQNCSQIFSFSFTNANAVTATVNGVDLNVEIGCNNPDLISGQDIADAIFDIVSDTHTQDALKNAIINGNPGATFEPGITIIGHANGLEQDGSKLIFYSIANGPTYNKGMGALEASNMVVPKKDFHLQTGANAYEGVPIELRTINTTTLKLGQLDVDSFFSAGDSIVAIQRAVQMVSDYRTYLGAIQNRLEHTVSNVKNTAENTTASESRIRDADMSTEMVDYSKSNILLQAGQSILAQNNKSLQSALSILQ